jgi:inner membrane protein
MPTVFSHAVIGLTIATVGKAPGPLGHLAPLWLVLFLAAASHGILDAMTTDGSGVAFSAHSTTPATSCRGGRSRSPGQFFSRRGVALMQAETLLLRLPAAVLAIVAAGRRGRRRGRG